MVLLLMSLLLFRGRGLSFIFMCVCVHEHRSRRQLTENHPVSMWAPGIDFRESGLVESFPAEPSADGRVYIFC